MTLQEILIALGGGSGVVGLVIAAVRSKAARSYLSRLVSAVDLSDAVKALQTVVEAQGESIEWLRNELSSAKQELEVARLQLAKTEALSIENAALRSRVADLEAQVHKLEDELKRRRGGRPRNV
jgi:predicted RNase H-like nuclease (RuvC/YqgF family)